MSQESNSQEPATNGDAPAAAEQDANRKKNGLKVELDLDDAPFLEEPEPQPENTEDVNAGKADAQPSPTAQEPPPNNRKRKLILAGAAAVVLLLVGVGVNFFLFPSAPAPKSAPEQPKAEPVKQPEPETVVVAPKSLPPAEVPLHTLQWDPFWVQLKDTEGAVRFLRCRFSTTTNSPLLFAEMTGKKLILRDALFYYLQNQPILSLGDQAVAARFKQELLSVINEHLGSGKVSELLLEEYLIQ